MGVRTAVQIMDVLQRLNDDGLTIVLVTHEPDIARFARRIVVCGDGHIRQDHPNMERTTAGEALARLPAMED